MSTKMQKSITVKDLKKELENLSDDMEIFLPGDFHRIFALKNISFVKKLFNFDNDKRDFDYLEEKERNFIEIKFLKKYNIDGLELARKCYFRSDSLSCAIDGEIDWILSRIEKVKNDITLSDFGKQEQIEREYEPILKTVLEAQKLLQSKEFKEYYSKEIIKDKNLKEIYVLNLQAFEHINKVETSCYL